MHIQVHFVVIPADPYWTTWPSDRSLALLAQDAKGIERRIKKGVNLRAERVRYTLLCTQIESLARQLADSDTKIRRARCAGSVVNLYLGLVERLQAANLSRGRSFFTPGDEVASERALFERLTKSVLEKDLGVRNEELEDAATFAASKAKFYKLAEQAGAAVVEVVSMPPFSPPK